MCNYIHKIYRSICLTRCQTIYELWRQSTNFTFCSPIFTAKIFNRSIPSPRSRKHHRIRSFARSSRTEPKMKPTPKRINASHLHRRDSIITFVFFFFYFSYLSTNGSRSHLTRSFRIFRAVLPRARACEMQHKSKIIIPVRTTEVLGTLKYNARRVG